jgi:hypothetical protein
LFYPATLTLVFYFDMNLTLTYNCWALSEYCIGVNMPRYNGPYRLQSKKISGPGGSMTVVGVLDANGSCVFRGGGSQAKVYELNELWRQELANAHRARQQELANVASRTELRVKAETLLSLRPLPWLIDGSGEKVLILTKAGELVAECSSMGNAAQLVEIAKQISTS